MQFCCCNINKLILSYCYIKELRQIIGENLTELRKSKKLTQLGLAEKFNYSDKAVSKWENGDTLPDIVILQQLCDFYGVTLDFLTHEGTAKEKAAYVVNRSERTNRLFISLLVGSSPWILATVIFVYTIIVVPVTNSWHIFWPVFVWAVPISSVLFLICNRVFWRNLIAKFVGLSVLLWSVIATFYVTSGFFNPTAWPNLWSLFLIGIPIQAALALWFSMKITRK